MTTYFNNIEYLKSGAERQQQAYRVLTAYQVLDKLEAYTPVLVGTIPINIDIESSDLDILCYWTDKREFMIAAQQLFGNQPRFCMREDEENEAVIVNFLLDDLEVELFGQNIPVKEQRAYRHMIVEHELLYKHGDEFRKMIIELKKQGYKTEPAFAHLLGLEGDPYEELLNYDNC